MNPIGDSITASPVTASTSRTAAPPETAAAPLAEATKQASAHDDPSVAELLQAARQLEQFMQSMNRCLEFRIDQDSGRTVVTVKDSATGDVIRQIPSEEVLRLAQNLGGKAHTALLSQTA